MTCWMYQECKAPPSIHTGYLSELCLNQATLRDEVTFSLGQRTGLLTTYYKSTEFPELQHKPTVCAAPMRAMASYSHRTQRAGGFYANIMFMLSAML